MSAFSEFFLGSPARTEQVQRFTPEQQQAYARLQQLGMQGLESGGTAGFEPIAAQERQEFQRKTIPSIAERFAALGGGQQSSAFGQQLAQAGVDLDSRLAALKSQYGLQGMQNYQNIANLGLTPQFESIYRPSTPSGIGQVAQGVMSGLGGGLPGLIAGGLSGLFGSLSGQRQYQQQLPYQYEAIPQEQQRISTQRLNTIPQATTSSTVNAVTQQPATTKPSQPFTMPVEQLLSTMLSNPSRYAGIPKTPAMPYLH